MLSEPSFGLYVPAGHSAKVMLALVAPTVAQKPPTGHRLHEEAPGDSLNLPIGHWVQSSEPRLSEYEPIRQGKQLTLPS